MRLKNFITLMLTIIICFSLISSAYADTAQKEEKILTIEEAINMALTRNADLAKAKYAVEQTELERKDAYEIIEYLPGSPYYVEGVSQAYLNYYWTDFYQKQAKRNYEFTKSLVTVETINKYYNVLSKINALDEAKKNEKFAQVRLSQVKAQKNVGMATELQVLKANQDYEAARVKLVSAQNELEKAYNELNDHIGLDPGARPILKDDVEFTPLEVDDINTVINRTISQRPDAWSAEEAAKVRELVKELTPNYKVGEIEVKKAEYDVRTVKEQIARDVKSMHMDIINLEKLIAAKQEAVNLASEAYRIAQLQYEIGLISLSDLYEQEANLAQAKNQLKSSIYNHEVAKASFPLLAGFNVQTTPAQ